MQPCEIPNEPKREGLMQPGEITDEHKRQGRMQACEIPDEHKPQGHLQPFEKRRGHLQPCEIPDEHKSHRKYKGKYRVAHNPTKTTKGQIKPSDFTSNPLMTDVNCPSPLVGLCQDMCPKKERLLREDQGRVHHFEALDGQSYGRGYKERRCVSADPNKAVKEYSRPAAGKELSSPYDLRPPDVLLRTVHYLLLNVWDCINENNLQNLSDAYSYVFDRLRAVRQDLTVQRIRGQSGALVLQENLGFLLCAPYIVRDLPIEYFDEVLHATQVRESFADLMECYTGNERNSREAEFQALLLFYDLGNLDTMNKALNIHHDVRDHPQVQLALAVNRAYLDKNWVRLFRLLRKLDCLQACAFYHHISSCRDKSLRTLVHAYSSRNCCFPLDYLTRLIAADNLETVAEMCERRGLSLAKGAKQAVVFFKASFKDIGPESSGKEVGLVEGKKEGRTWAKIMMGTA